MSSTRDDTVRIGRGLFPGRILATPLLAMAMSLCWVPVSLAAVETATLSGVVVLEQDGSPLPGATVTATDEPRGVSYSAVTDASGKFRIALLKPSTYTVAVELPAFASYRVTGQQFVVGQETVLRIALRPAAQATVEVKGEIELIDPTASQISSIVTPQQVQSLPLPTRNYLDLALLAPGTTPGRDVAFSGVVAGGAQEARWTYVALDGADNNNFIVGGQQANVSQDTVQEFQVLGYNFSAEYGRSNALVINVLTKSGSNDPHGSAYYYYRDRHMTEDPFFSNVPKSDYRRSDWGATIGGPILRDKVFFFGSYDELDVNAPIFVDIKARPDLSGFTPVRTERRLAFAKVDVAASSSQRLTLSYRYDKRDNTNLIVGGNFTASYGYAQTTKSQGGILTHQWVRSSNLYNELRLSLLDFDQDSRPNVTTPAQQHPTYSLGGNPRFPQGGTEKRYGVADTIAWTAGNHFIKFGADYSRWKGEVFFALFTNGQFRFQGPGADSAAAKPFLYVKGFGDPTTVNDIDFYGAFVQDEWKATDRLTLNLGLRYDFQDGAANADYVSPFGIPNARKEDDNNLAPRLGFAYVLDPARNTVVRGGGGIFYFELFNNLSLNEDIFNGQKFRISIFPCFAVPGGCDASSPPPDSRLIGIASEIRSNAPNIQTPYTVTYNLGIASEIPGGWAASLDAVYSRGYHELGEVRENLLANPANPNSRPDPRVGSIRRVRSDGMSKYYAFLTSVRRALTEKWQAQLSYTFAKALNDAEFFAIAVSNSRLANPFAADYGPARNDQRHRLVLNSSYELPWGFSTGTIVTVASGFPYNVRAGADLNADDTADQDRPPGFSRNDQRSKSYFRWDLRLAKRFTLGPVAFDLIGEVFNLTNTKNYDPAFYVNVKSAADFGKPRFSNNDLYQPRQFQVAARVSF